VTIAIIEDNKKYSECLAAGLGMFPDCNIIHLLSNGMNLISRFFIEIPDIALVDINLPGIGGEEAVKIISENFPSVKCIMLTVNADLDMVITCLGNGAKGYLLKDKDNIQKIVECMRIVNNENYNEEFPLNGILAKKLLIYFANKQKTQQEKLQDYQLTKRQTEILNLLYNGKSYKEISDICSITLDTLKSHIKSIYPKLKINSRNEIKSIIE
jgi:DNA-binding NarL/FixJ family response regulator